MIFFLKSALSKGTFWNASAFHSLVFPYPPVIKPFHSFTVEQHSYPISSSLKHLLSCKQNNNSNHFKHHCGEASNFCFTFQTQLDAAVE